jgi:AraC family transcriptional regulator of adaptative response/methylated-DNA-[protein]-cysteine methyltransferase
MKIPYGETKSYLEQANMINRPSAHRAVANANGSNNLAIIIPCHRILRNDGNLGGYAGGINRKKWLIEHEKKNKNTIVS